jgi:hypothetical protein
VGARRGERLAPFSQSGSTAEVSDNASRLTSLRLRFETRVSELFCGLSLPSCDAMVDWPVRAEVKIERAAAKSGRGDCGLAEDQNGRRTVELGRRIEWMTFCFSG